MSVSETRDPAALSYEEARDELIQVVQRLEQGGSTLEESLQLWERGEVLAARCEEWLLGARQRLETARQQADAGAANATGTSATEDLA
ncbi:exodeoxyribonuclease VII small subunit [Leucobacter sp. PH1c]|uniref:exodeoxyribonuclease VII small subunit n=1 Tax=Leucobacter sp. PH1c TaxID=1397278 RepID=UPI00046860AF|nr:exodeoxyribonuclease VII small subunit [Leucobacter sp. PH1c]